MGYDTEVAKICRLSNGWELEIYDPPPEEKKAEDKAAKKGAYIPSEGIYKSPWRTLAFATFDELIEYLEEKGASLKPRNYDDEYAAEFAKTAKALAVKAQTEEKEE